jgi:hypothetical protein
VDVRSRPLSAAGIKAAPHDLDRALFDARSNREYVSRTFASEEGALRRVLPGPAAASPTCGSRRSEQAARLTAVERMTNLS